MNGLLHLCESPPSVSASSRADQTRRKIRAGYGIDFREAIREHNEWKKIFCVSISREQALDVESISKDTCCDFGRWLQDDPWLATRHPDSYVACCDAHKAFHLEAAKVARAINDKRAYEAKRMLAVGASYSAVSIALGFAITRLMKVANLRELRR
jgi:methyl-accepting chemotaxis protein